MSSSHKILLLDDDEANMLFFETMLAQSEKSFSIFKAHTADQGEEVVSAEHIEFIVCAWEMRPVSGTVFVQRLKRDKNKMYIPFVIYSKRMAEEDILLTKEMGVDNVLGMPFNRQKALDMIMKMVETEERTPTIEKRLRRIEVLIKEGKYNEALKHADNSIFKHPQASRVHSIMGEIWIGIRNFPKAKEYLDKSLQNDPEHTHSLRLLARWYSLQDKHQEAIEILQKLAAKCPKNLKTIFNLGQAYAAANDFDNAEKQFKKIEDTDENMKGIKDERGLIAFKKGDIPLAAQLLSETENATELARTFNDMGIAKIGTNKFDEGIQLYMDAIRILADKTKVHLIQYNLALGIYKKGDAQKAFEAFCHSYITEPAFEKAYNALAKVARDLKAKGVTLNPRLVESVKAKREAFKKSPDAANIVED